MGCQIQKEATEAGFGKIATDKRTYRPLDTVRVFVRGRERGDSKCMVEVLDSKLTPYFRKVVVLKNNKGKVDFIAGGELGSHVIHLYFQDNVSYRRRVFFRVECETRVNTGNEAYDSLYPITKEALLLNRRKFEVSKKPFVGYMCVDTSFTDAVSLIDWIPHFPGCVFWENELTSGLERFLELQKADGSFPYAIMPNGYTWRPEVASDVEYLFVIGIWSIWRVTGDRDWLKKSLPYLEKGLDYVKNSRKRWDKRNELVTRGHTCDTWDFEFINRNGENRPEKKKSWLEWDGKNRVIATCDQSGYYLAFKAMAEMYQGVGEKSKSGYYRKKAREFRNRANSLLWDGKKYLHHIHVDPVEHPGFDEQNQLTLGNVWAMARGLADHKKAISIIREYQDRHKKTGDAYPWWSLQPGYPESLGYYDSNKSPHLQQGAYSNGGLLPFVGGELCRASFEHGVEEYGVELLNQYLNLLKDSGNEVCVWYWTNGEPGIRTTNEVRHNGWGMTEWLIAFLEGLGGIKDKSGQMKKVKLSPRWSITSETRAYVAVRYAVNNCYFAYQLEIDKQKKEIRLDYTGSGKLVRFHVLLPKGWRLQSVNGDKKLIKLAKEEIIEKSVYVNFTRTLKEIGSITIICKK